MKTDLEIVMQDIVSNGLAHQEDGHVDSDSGYFSVVEIPEHPAKFGQLMTDLYGASWEKEELELPVPGWYYVTEDTAGCVWVTGPESAERCQYWFEEDSDEYAKSEDARV